MPIEPISQVERLRNYLGLAKVQARIDAVVLPSFERDIDFVGASFAAYEELRRGGRLDDPRFSRLVSLAREWCAVADHDPQVEKFNTTRERLFEGDVSLFREIFVAYQLVEAGFDVDARCLKQNDFADIDVSGSDFERTAIEVKVLRETTGMPITGDGIDAFLAALTGRLGAPSSSFVVRVRCEGRFEATHAYQLAEQVARFVSADVRIPPTSIPGGYLVEVERFTDLTATERMQLLDNERRRDTLHQPFVIVWLDPDADPDISPFGAIAIRSQRESRVAETVIERIAESVRQLPVDRPGIVNVHLLAAMDWLELASDDRLSLLAAAGIAQAVPNPPGLVVFSGEPLNPSDKFHQTVPPTYAVGELKAQHPVPAAVRSVLAPESIQT